MSPTREDVVAEALSWAGTPYLHQGDVKGPLGGVDCAMILVRVYKKFRLIPDDVDPRPYPMQWHLHRNTERYLGWFKQHARQVESPLPADVALYRFGRTVSHAAIILPGAKIIHSFREAGAVVCDEMRALEHRFDSYWSLF